MATADIGSEADYLAYGDESNTQFRYPAVTLLSGQRAFLSNVEASLCTLLAREMPTRRFHWKKIDGYRCRAAMRILDLLAEAPPDFRVDILTWDVRDKPFGRQENRKIDLPNMYRILARWVLENGWPSGVSWGIISHRREGFDFAGLGADLSDLGVRFVSDYDDHAYRLLQVADMFGGMVTYSRTHAEAFQEFLSIADGRRLPLDDPRFSVRDRHRFAILSHFLDVSQRAGWGIMLEDDGLVSAIPDFIRPVTLWRHPLP